MRFWWRKVDGRLEELESRVSKVERQNEKAHMEFDEARRNLERLIGDLKRPQNHVQQ